MDALDRIAIMQQFGRTYRAFMAGFEARVGLPLPRWRILLALHMQAGDVSQKRLVELLKIDPGALTRQLKALESLGWVVRASDVRDNRVTNVALSELGQAAVVGFLPRREAYFKQTIHTLPEASLEALSEALAQLEMRVSAATAEPSRPTPASPR